MENRQYKTKELFRRFLPYFKPYWKTMVFDLSCAGLTTLCELVLPMIMRFITNEGIRDVASLSMRTVGMMVGLYLLLRIVDCIAAYYMAGTGHIMGARIETDMRRDAYRHLQQLSNTYYNNTKVGQIMGRITNDLFDVTEFAHHCPEEFFIAGVKLLISFVILARINVLLTLIIFIIIPVMVAVCMKLNFRMRAVFRTQRHHIGELNARIEDSLLGQKVVKAFTNEDMENQKFENDNGRFLDIKRDSYHLMRCLFYLDGIFQPCFFFDALGYIVRDAYQKLVSIGCTYIRFGGFQNDFVLSGKVHLFLKRVACFSVNGFLVIFTVLPGVIRREDFVIVLSDDFCPGKMLYFAKVFIDHKVPEVVACIFDKDDSVHLVYQELRKTARGLREF